MPRYHFHLRDNLAHPDQEGVALPDCTAARRMALRHMAEILRDASDEKSPTMDWRIEVTDEDGLMLFALATLAYDAPAIRR